MNDPTELVKFAKCYAEAWRSQAGEGRGILLVNTFRALSL